MGNYDTFANSNKDLEKLEKINGRYGCKFCKKESDTAYWDRNQSKMIWVCADNHRSEMQFD
ncbi:MAG: hypothetical protein RLZZ196_91 [Bacteroidota bacterium]|jgi:hypothetical protein